MGGLGLAGEVVDLPRSAVSITGEIADLPPEPPAPQLPAPPTQAKAERDEAEPPPPRRGGAASPPGQGNKTDLEAFVTSSGYTLGHFALWAKDTGQIEGEIKSWEDVPEDIGKRLLRSKTGLLKGLEQAKAVMPPSQPQEGKGK